MLFAQPIYLLLCFPLFFLIYYACPGKYRNAAVLIGSLLFYAWGAPKFVFVLIASSWLDYAISHRLSSHKRWLHAGIVLNLSLLLVFKYFGFFVENALEVMRFIGFHPSVHFIQIGLPLGLSFFTFQKISYLMDVHRGHVKPAQRFDQYLLFVALFPQLIAGPILRFKVMAPQLKVRGDSEAWVHRWEGFKRFGLGLAKKVLIADNLAPLASSLFEGEASGVFSWLALMAYAMQLYYDFSGYSDMAIGMGRMMDFRFPENFHWPYTACSIREFWQRWHITLSQWMRDYLYIPLGGNRLGALRTGVNLWTVFLLSGLWHGAQWTFVLWGAWHGLFMAAERYWPKRWRRTWLGWPYAFLVATLGWVLFRAADLSNAWDVLGKLFFSTTWEMPADWTTLRTFILCIALAFALVPQPWQPRLAFKGSGQHVIGQCLAWLLVLLAMALSIAQLAIRGVEPFIYFRF